MQENLPDPPIDILEDAPAEPVDFSSKMQEDNANQGIPVAKSESNEAQEALSKKYSNEDVYTIISLVQHYPSGGHGGESFWNLMVKVYGDTLLEGRNGGGLRGRWRKLIKDHPSDLEEYKKQLAATLPPEFIRSVENKISTGITDTSKLVLNSKAYATLFPNAPKVVDAGEKGVKKKKLDEGEVELIVEEKKRTRRPTFKIHIDLNSLVRKRSVSKLVNEVITAEIKHKIEFAKSFVIVRDVKKNELEVKSIKEIEEIEVNEKPNLEQDNLFKRPGNKSNKGWTELEDMVLRYPISNEIYNSLIKIRGENEIIKRKSFLGLT